MAKMCKGLGDRPKVVRVDTIEDALPNDVLVEEADEGDGRWIEPADGVVGLVLGPEVSFTNPI